MATIQTAPEERCKHCGHPVRKQTYVTLSDELIHVNDTDPYVTAGGNAYCGGSNYQKAEL